MPIFTCTRCGTVDNSALGGTYWSRNMPELFPVGAIKRGEVLCCVCAPPTFRDGTPNRDAGKWHNKFPRRNAKGEHFTPDAVGVTALDSAPADQEKTCEPAGPGGVGC